MVEDLRVGFYLLNQFKAETKLAKT